MATKRYSIKQYPTLRLNLSKEQMRDFRRACFEINRSMSDVVTSYIKRFTKNNSKQNQELSNDSEDKSDSAIDNM